MTSLYTGSKKAYEVIINQIKRNVFAKFNAWDKIKQVNTSTRKTFGHGYRNEFVQQNFEVTDGLVIQN